jgi:dihydropteroate synthase
VGSATQSTRAGPTVTLPDDAPIGIAPTAMPPIDVRGRSFAWGERTYVMGILNLTPDSFSGDGILARDERQPVEVAVEQARRMASEGADLLDVGGESTRPGHEPVDVQEELARVVPVVAAVRDALPDMPISIDTTKAPVARAALDAGADLVNDIWGVRPEPELLGLVATQHIPIVLMHNRDEARYRNVVAEVLADLERAVESAVAAGVDETLIIVDPGIGFGKTAEHNLAVLHRLGDLRVLGRPILLGTSRKSMIGRILDTPPQDRLEGTLATTALAIAGGVDIVRVHDVEANCRVARVSDAIVRRRGLSASEADVSATPRRA